MNRIRAELSVLALYSRLGVERPTGLLDTRLVPRLASAALARTRQVQMIFYRLQGLAEVDLTARAC